MAGAMVRMRGVEVSPAASCLDNSDWPGHKLGCES